ncbi:aminotransferase class V-fold PLP-dependent enzyme [Fimbriiglobus ruber]|uniref:Aminotransferase class V domain-containing protein n=1 Tax=Fimbriiglobus ruber TaxID=1908690 RepID=A0A225DTP5_9BACT|nr:aminotransferase class V-fold PLP-dependent enzyme [Fimbriiglobus ruber]OWK40956.1 hypothetical protein FRUB_04848 [Fimbriiglobus ruber]
MDEFLYLDTARVGRMSPGAHRAAADYLSLAATEGGSAYFGRFLRSGFAACPDRMRACYPGLTHWNGIASLKHSLRALAGSRPDLPILLASRSAQLMRLSARLLFQRCRCVLASDLGWPGYHAILEAEGRRVSRPVTVVPLYETVGAGRMTEEEVVDTMCREYVARRCDGLFLTAVSHLGVRLPVERIVRRLEAAHEVRFVVVDGAQDFCHASADLRDEYCDFYLTGCHKWLRAYHPLGLGFYGRRRTQGVIETTLSHLKTAGELDDPLLRFSMDLEAGGLDRYSETVNLAPLFSCQGAVADGCVSSDYPHAVLAARLRNRDVIAGLAAESGWQPTLPAHGLRSGILLAQACRPQRRRIEPETLWDEFRNRGVALTAYEGGWIRFSMPEAPLADKDIHLLRNALRLAA